MMKGNVDKHQSTYKALKKGKSYKLHTVTLTFRDPGPKDVALVDKLVGQEVEMTLVPIHGELGLE